VADDSNAMDVGARYALALFNLADETGVLSAVEADLKAFEDLRVQSPELRTLLVSPRFTAEDKARGLAAIADRAGFNDTTRKFLGVVSGNGRAAALAAIVQAFKSLAASRRGVVSAQVVTAAPMTAAQSKALSEGLRQALGKDPEIETRVDPAILGGVKVRVGSRLYDASLKSKLDSLKFALKRA